MRTIVYVDGFNFYHGLVKRSGYKWLDLYKLFEEQLLPIKGLIDAVAFGRDWIANPDLVARLQRKAELNPQRAESFYGGFAISLPPDKRSRATAPLPAHSAPGERYQSHISPPFPESATAHDDALSLTISFLSYRPYCNRCCIAALCSQPLAPLC